jgi:transcriptional regulator with XRE-family HTH domain
MHELIAKGVAEARRRQGWTQEQTANAFRVHGLHAWRKGTVGQLEAGLRKPRFDELLLMARALGVTLDKLIPGGDDEVVELGDGAEVSPRWIREMLAGDFFGQLVEDAPYERFPMDDAIAEAMSRSAAENKRVWALLEPIRQWAKLHDIRVMSAVRFVIWNKASDTERHAAQRLGIEIVQLKLAAWVLWEQRSFDEERDRRVGDVDQLEPRSRQARRGLVTREMLAELRAVLEEAYAGQGEGGNGER